MVRNRRHTYLWVPLFLMALSGSLAISVSESIASQHGNAMSLFDKIDLLVAKTSENRPRVIEYFDARPGEVRVQLSWIAFSDDMDGFRIYRRNEGEPFFTLVNRDGLIPAWLQNYLDLELQPSTRYEYLLGVVLSDGSELLSQPIEATTTSKAFAAR